MTKGQPGVRRENCMDSPVEPMNEEELFATLLAQIKAGVKRDRAKAAVPPARVSKDARPDPAVRAGRGSMCPVVSAPGSFDRVTTLGAA